jgi:hypothetical protein
MAKDNPEAKMKKVKTIIWIVIAGLVVLVVVQNWGYFGTRQPLNIDLVFAQYQVPEFPNLLLFLVCFLVGLLLPYVYYGLIERHRQNKMIKKLRAATEAQQEEILALKRELEMSQRPTAEIDPQPADTPAAITEMS